MTILMHPNVLVEKSSIQNDWWNQVDVVYQSQHSLNECAVGLGRQANLVSTAAKTLEKFLLSCKIHLDEDRPMLSGQQLVGCFFGMDYFMTNMFL